MGARTPHSGTAIQSLKPSDAGQFPLDIERKFEEDYFERSLGPQRRGISGILVISLFSGLLNAYLPQPAREITLATHYFFLIPVLAVLLASTFMPFYRPWSQYLMALGVLIFAGTYITFEHFAPTVPGSECSRTTVVLILVVMAASTVLRMQYRYAAVCCYLCFCVYAVLSFTVFHLPEPAWNAGALLAACVLGNFITKHTEKSARSDFMLRYQLEEEQLKLDAQNVILDNQNHRLSQIAELRLQAAVHAEHEIKNKLNAVSKPIQVAARALERGSDSARYRLYLDDALTGISDLNQLLQMMLNIARLKAGYAPSLGPAEPVCLEEIVRDVCNNKISELNLPCDAGEQAAASGTALELHVETSLLPVPISLHRYAVRLVLENLLENAVKYSVNGGTITASTSKTGEEVIACVADQGIGITRERLSRLFDAPYDRGQADEFGVTGTGIGLQIIKKLMDAQGGRIWAESDGEGRGASFFVSFPRG